VGKGLHSEKNIPKIKPAIEGILARKKISYVYTSGGGAISISLEDICEKF